MKAEDVRTQELKKEVLRFPHSNVRNQIAAYEDPSKANEGLQLFNSQGWRAVQICVEDNRVIVLLESI